MDGNDISPNPDADSYHDRLDIPGDAEKSLVRSAWKVASSQYHPDNSASEATQQNYIQLRKARDVLKNPNKRRIYRSMCQRCGDEYGTELYETWVSQGKPMPVSDWIENHSDSPTSSSDASSSETSFDSSSSARAKHSSRKFSSDEIRQIAKMVGSPTIEWANFDPDQVSVHTSLGDTDRLYIKSPLLDNMYLNLETGKLVGGRQVKNMTAYIEFDEGVMGISDGESLSFRVDLEGDQSSGSLNSPPDDATSVTPTSEPSSRNSGSNLNNIWLFTRLRSSNLYQNAKDWFYLEQIHDVYSQATNPIISVCESIMGHLTLSEQHLDKISTTPFGKLADWEFPPSLFLRLLVVLFAVLFVNPVDVPLVISLPIIAVFVFFPSVGVPLTLLGLVASTFVGGEYLFATVVYAVGFASTIIYYFSVQGTRFE